jgi:hypothetical protein
VGKINQLKIRKLKIDAWKAEYALLLIKFCNFPLKKALIKADSQIKNIKSDIDKHSPQEMAFIEVLAMNP